MEYNKKHNIIPKSVTKAVFGEVSDRQEKTDKKRQFVYTATGVMDAESLRKEIAKLTKQMRKSAEDLEFERAGEIRDTIRRLEEDLLLIA